MSGGSEDARLSTPDARRGLATPARAAAPRPRLPMPGVGSRGSGVLSLPPGTRPH